MPSFSSDLLHENVTLTKTFHPECAEIGDKVTTIMTVTVPQGISLYNLQVTCNYPSSTQLYQDNAALDNQPVSPVVIPGKVIFPNIPLISINNDNIQLVFTFDSLIIGVETFSTVSDEHQYEATISWEAALGVPAIPISVTNSLPIITPKNVPSIRTRLPSKLRDSQVRHFGCFDQGKPISIMLMQKNVDTGGSFKKGILSGLPGDTVYYKLIVNLNIRAPVYDINLAMDLGGGIVAFDKIISVSSGTVKKNGAVIKWHIPVLDNLPSPTQEVLVISVTIKSGIRAGAKIFNKALAKYRIDKVNANITSSSNSAIVKISPLTVKVSASPQSAALGAVILYRISLIIPDGVVVPHLVLYDEIPQGQSYISGSWKPGPQPEQSGNTLIFVDPNILEVGPLTLTYCFMTNVDYALFPPYSVVQTNYLAVRWNIILNCPGSPVCTSTDVLINIPNVTSLKEQRKISANSDFTTEPLHHVFPGDTIEYRITLTNISEGVAYHVQTTDVLDPALTYLGVVGITPPGNVYNSVPASSPDGTLTWNDFNLGAGLSAVLTFQVRVNANMPDNQSVVDQTSTTYAANAKGEILLGPVLSNQVLLFSDPIPPKIQPECILANKIYSQCQRRICFEKVQTFPPDGYNLNSISYSSGTIVAGTLQITPLPERLGFSRITFDVSVPYQAMYISTIGNVIKQDATIPSFQMDIIFYLPKSRIESLFNVIADTRSTTLAVDRLSSTFAAGIIVVVSVTCYVQLLIPTFGFCDITGDCEE